MRFTSPVYMKLFTSAEMVSSLGANSGVEAQFSNRISSIETSEMELDNREVFRRVGKTAYRESLTHYIARELNQAVEEYLLLGRQGSADKADRFLAEYIEENTISKKMGMLEDSIKEYAEDIKEMLRRCENPNIGSAPKWAKEFYEANTTKVEFRGKAGLLLKYTHILVEHFIKNNVSFSERVSVSMKTRQIVTLIDDTGRVDLNRKIRVKIAGVSNPTRGVVTLL